MHLNFKAITIQPLKQSWLKTALKFNIILTNLAVYLLICTVESCRYVTVYCIMLLLYQLSNIIAKSVIFSNGLKRGENIKFPKFGCLTFIRHYYELELIGKFISKYKKRIKNFIPFQFSAFFF